MWHDQRSVRGRKRGEKLWYEIACNNAAYIKTNIDIQTPSEFRSGAVIITMEEWETKERKVGKPKNNTDSAFLPPPPYLVTLISGLFVFVLYDCTNERNSTTENIRIHCDRQTTATTTKVLTLASVSGLVRGGCLGWLAFAVIPLVSRGNRSRAIERALGEWP